MSNDNNIEQQLACVFRPRRELGPDFTRDTLAKALTPRWWRHLRTAPVAAAVVILLTAGSAYAAFNWQNVQVWFTGMQQNSTFDAQEFGFRVDTCDSIGNKKMRFGVVPRANVQPEQIAAIIRARCDTAQARQLFAGQADWQKPSTNQGPVDDIEFNGAIVTIDHLGAETLHTTMAAQDPQGKPQATHMTDRLAKEVRVFIRGNLASLDALKPGDRVTRVVHTTERRIVPNGPAVIQSEVVGLITVDASSVDPSLAEVIFEIMPCQGNPEATCVDAPSPALLGSQFHINEGEGGNIKVRKDITITAAGVQGGSQYVAQGRVTAMDAAGFTIRAFESEAEFRVNMPEIDRKAPYNLPTRLALGDAVAIRYLQKANEDHKVISVSDIQASFIIMASQNEKL